jgi:hypothetical protein
VQLAKNQGNDTTEELTWKGNHWRGVCVLHGLWCLFFFLPVLYWSCRFHGPSFVVNEKGTSLSLLFPFKGIEGNEASAFVLVIVIGVCRAWCFCEQSFFFFASPSTVHHTEQHLAFESTGVKSTYLSFRSPVRPFLSSFSSFSTCTLFLPSHCLSPIPICVFPWWFPPPPAPPSPPTQ